jgi:hypothetical protein
MYGRLVGQKELVAQPATKDQEGVQGPVLFWGKGRRRKGEGGDETRVAREESQRQRAGRLFCG